MNDVNLTLLDNGDWMDLQTIFVYRPGDATPEQLRFLADFEEKRRAGQPKPAEPMPES